MHYEWKNNIQLQPSSKEAFEKQEPDLAAYNYSAYSVSLQYNLPLSPAFEDFEKIFDSVEHWALE